MKKGTMSKRNWRILGFYIIGWTLAMLFLAIVRGVGTEELGELKFDFAPLLAAPSRWLPARPLLAEGTHCKTKFLLD